MKTIITKKIDGYTVVKGIDRPTIDAVTTRVKIDESLIKDPLVLEIAQKCSQAEIIAKKWNKSRKKRRLAAQTQTLDEQFTAICLEISKLKKQVDEKRFQMSKEEPIYFDPKPGEIIVTDEEAAEYVQLIRDAHRAVVLLEKKYALDYRGLNYWHKKDGRWDNFTVEKLGETPPDYYYTRATLTDEMVSEIRQQVKDDQISEMDPEQKKRSKEKDEEIAAEQAVFLRSKLEIKGDPDPMGGSRDWYKQELERIEDRYR
jgi:hypothetical protein